jgi:hypothetical protein
MKLVVKSGLVHVCLDDTKYYYYYYYYYVRTKVIPVMVGATGTTSKLFTKYLSNTPPKHDIK